MSKPEILEIPLEQIIPDPSQPRKYFNEETIEQLAKSISVHGLLQPILVRPRDGGNFQIVHGERRFKAHQKLRLPTIQCIIRQLSDKEAADVQLVENLERNDLTDIEFAWEFKRRIDAGQSHSQIAKIIGKSKSFVTQRLALLKLSKEEQLRMLRGELGFSNARQLLSIKDPSLRKKASEQITDSTTVMQTATMINQSEAVTHVTDYEPISQINVRELATYKLLINRETVASSELLTALAKDLKLLRGG